MYHSPLWADHKGAWDAVIYCGEAKPSLRLSPMWFLSYTEQQCTRCNKTGLSYARQLHRVVRRALTPTINSMTQTEFQTRASHSNEPRQLAPVLRNTPELQDGICHTYNAYVCLTRAFFRLQRKTGRLHKSNRSQSRSSTPILCLPL